MIPQYNYILTRVKLCFIFCCVVLQIVKKSTGQVLSDQSWLEAPEEVVLKVLEMNSMRCSEVELIENLLKWGRAQVEDEADLRAKVDNGLKLIRFCTMGKKEFSNLVRRQPTLLTASENQQIFLTLSERNSDLLPETFSKLKKPRCMRKTGRVYEWKNFQASDWAVGKDKTVPVSLVFTIEPVCYLSGLTLRSLAKNNAGQQVELLCDVYKTKNLDQSLTTATFNGIVEADGRGKLFFPWPVLIHPLNSYTINVCYKHTTPVPTSTFKRTKSYSWTDDPNLKVTVVFAGNIKRIIDISGLIIAKKRVWWYAKCICLFKKALKNRK